jgi:hypothetical protein
VFLARVFGLDGGPHFGVGLFNKNIAMVHGSPLRQWAGFAHMRNQVCPGERLIAVTLSS